METFTEEQIEDWKAYEKVLQSGRINMLDVKSGCALSGLTEERYLFALKNYSELESLAK